MFRLIISLLLGVVLSGMPIGAGEKTAPYSVAVSVYNTNEFIRSWTTHLGEHPLVQDGTVKLRLYNGLGSVHTQFAQMNDILVLGHDAVIIVANDLTSSGELIRMAGDAGMPVVASSAQVRMERVTAFIGPDDVEAGYESAKALFERLGGVGRVAVIGGPPEQGAVIQRELGIVRALAEYPGIILAERKVGDWTRSSGSMAMHHWLAYRPGRIDGIIAHNDEMALGAVTAMKLSNAVPLPIVGVDGLDEAVAAVEKGEMVQTLRQDARAEAQGALDIVLRRLAGEGYTPHAACWDDGMAWNEGAAEKYRVPWVVVKALDVAGAP